MKKTILVLTIIGLSLSAFAQVDTFSVRNMPGNYFLGDWPGDSNFVSTRYNNDGSVSILNLTNDAWIEMNTLVGYVYGLNGRVDFSGDSLVLVGRQISNYAAGKYADDTIKVNGIALAYPRYYYYLYQGQTDMKVNIRDMFLLNGRDMLNLQLLNTNMQVLAEGVNLLSDSIGKPVFLFDCLDVNAANNQPDGLLYDIYEVYFDTPLLVTDSFYLASHFINSTREEDDFGVAIPVVYETFASMYVEPYYRFPEHSCRAQGGVRYYYDSVSHTMITEQVPDGEWFTLDLYRDHGYTMIFPILAVDCAAPDSVAWAPMGGGNVRVSWEAGEWTSGWEVSYGPTGTLPGEGTVLQTTAPAAMLSGITMDTDYVVYVRSLCTVRDTVWSEWSVGMPFTLRPQGIETIDNAGLTLAPNPASGEVLLTADAEMTGVEVYTAAGVPFLRLPATGRTMHLDTTAWPTGTYLLVIATGQGTVTRRLTVAR